MAFASPATSDFAPPKKYLRRQRLVAFGAWCLALMAAFYLPLRDLVRLAANDLHSHTLLIPFISAYLVYVERRRLPAQCTTSWGPALVLGCFALALVVAAKAFASSVLALGPEGPTVLFILGFVSLVNAGGFLFLGAAWMKAMAFPMGFLCFMVPLPGAIVYYLEDGLKLASAEVAGWFFDLSGTPVLHDGVFFRLPRITIEVAQECSGIHSSYVLLMTSCVAAYLFLRSPWRRAILVSAIIPLGIIRNGFRILVLGLLCVHYGPQMIDTWIHHHGGPVFFALSLLPLFLLIYWLWRGEHAKPVSVPAVRILP